MKKTSLLAGAIVLALSLAFEACQSTAAAPGVPPRLTGVKALVTIGGGTPMTPEFSPETTDYSLSVQSDIATVGIVATAGAGARGSFLIGKKTAHSGAVVMIDLAVGDNVIPITLTGADGATEVYSVHVNRENITPVVDSFLKATYSDPSTGVTLSYRLFVPANYDSAKSYPLVFFLHGAGDRGSDNLAPLMGTQGGTVWAKPDEQAKHPAFVLAPQCPGDPNGYQNGWTTLMTKGLSAPFTVRPELEAAYNLLQSVISRYNIDKNRIYGTGFSMGGFGMWAIAAEHPGAFAALVVACGGGDPARLPALAKTPAWIFHAVNDPTIPVSFGRATAKALVDAGGTPKYTEYPADTYFYPIAHVAWIPAYASAAMRDWVFTQSRQ